MSRQRGGVGCVALVVHVQSDRTSYVTNEKGASEREVKTRTPFSTSTQLTNH